MTDQNIKKVRSLAKVASDLDISLANLAIAWCLKNQHVSTVITGASRLSQLKENLKASDAVTKLDDNVMAHIEDILKNQPERPAY